MNTRFRASTLAVLLSLLALWTSPAFAQTASPDVDAACRALMTTSPDDSADAPAIRITQPGVGDVVTGDQVEVNIETTNFDLSDGHWHVYVDGELHGMVFEPRTVLELEPGTHTVCAMLGDAEHMELGLPAGVTVTVAEPAADAPTPTPIPNVAPPQPETTAPSPTTIIPVLIAAGLAVVGGWWLGKRLPK